MSTGHGTCCPAAWAGVLLIFWGIVGTANSVEAQTEVPAPTNVRVQVDSDSSWTVRWDHDAPGVTIKGYNVTLTRIDGGTREERQTHRTDGSDSKQLSLPVVDSRSTWSGNQFIRGDGYGIEVSARYGFTATARSEIIYFGTPPAPTVTAIWDSDSPHQVLVRWRSTAQSSRGGSGIVWEAAAFIAGASDPRRRTVTLLPLADRTREAVVLLDSGTHTWTVTVRGNTVRSRNDAGSGWGPTGQTTVTATVPASPNPQEGFHDEKPFPPTIGLVYQNPNLSDLYWEYTNAAHNYQDVGLRQSEFEFLELRNANATATFEQVEKSSHSTTLTSLYGQKSFTHADYRDRAPLRIRIRGIADSSVADEFETGTWTEAVVFGGAPPPTFLHATPGDGRVRLRWGLPTHDASIATPDGYVILYSTATQPIFPADNAPAADVTTVDVDRTATEHMLPGLTNGQTYYISMRAKGPGAYRSTSSTQVEVQPDAAAATLAGAPHELVATVRGGEVALAWQPPTDDGLSAITGYVIEHSTDSRNYSSLVANTNTLATEHSVLCGPNLHANTPHHFRVRAINRVGNGRWSNSVTATMPDCPPDPPIGLMAVATAVDRTELRWQPPAANGGTPVTAYRIERRAVGATEFDPKPRLAETAEHVATHYVDRTPPAATVNYEYVVIAFNQLGAGTRSAVVARDWSVPVDVDAQVRSSLWVRVRWSPPINNAEDPVSEYQVERLTGDGEWEPRDEQPVADGEQFVLDDRSVTDAREQVFSYRVTAVRTPEDPAMEPTTAAAPEVHSDPTVPLPWPPEIDLNSDGFFTEEDALVMHYHFSLPETSSANLRKTFLGPLTLDNNVPTDATLVDWLAKAQQWVTTDGVYLDGDFDGSGSITQSDAAILYYTFAFPQFLRVGQTDSELYDAIRMELIGSLEEVGNAPDPRARTQQAISAADELILR